MFRRSDEKIRLRLQALEQEAREHPRRHRLRLFGLVMLGYSYPLLLALIVLALVGVLIFFIPDVYRAVDDGRALFLYGCLILAGIACAVVILRSLWVELPMPRGMLLNGDEAMPLRKTLDDLSASFGRISVHGIYINSDFNASVTQRPPFGFWGPRRNYLMIGLPLLLSTTPEQFRAILAHEFAHLRASHNAFGAWIYRLQGTWTSIAQALAKTGRLRLWIIGFFWRWYGEYFATTALPLRRLHEYDADAQGAGATSKELAGSALINIAWNAYRLEKTFWPTLLRQAANTALPPQNFLSQLSDYFQRPAADGEQGRWQRYELSCRTPVTSDHPCLLDRLSALDCQRMLSSQNDLDRATVPPADINSSAASLLGDNGLVRSWDVTNAFWKTMVIGRWRFEHARAAYRRENPQAEIASVESNEPHDSREWQQLRTELESLDPESALSQLETYIAIHPSHPHANFESAKLLLLRDDEAAAVERFEAAMKSSSEYILPALSMLRDYYRSAGRDHEADGIHSRLAEHERALAAAQKERLRVRRSDRFVPHNLPPGKIHGIGRILYRYPRITTAYLVRKEVNLFADAPVYVLAIHRRKMSFEDNGRIDKNLIRVLGSEMPVRCAVFILPWRRTRIYRRILAACPAAIFLASRYDLAAGSFASASD